MDGNTYRVIKTEYNNPGRGAASVRAQLMDIGTGSTQYRVFSAEDSLNNLYVETFPVKYLYGDDDLLHFMNMETYDQYDVNRSLFGDDALYLREDMDLQLNLNGARVLDYQLPTTMVYSDCRGGSRGCRQHLRLGDQAGQDRYRAVGDGAQLCQRR